MTALSGILPVKMRSQDVASLETKVLVFREIKTVKPKTFWFEV